MENSVSIWMNVSLIAHFQNEKVVIEILIKENQIQNEKFEACRGNLEFSLHV